MACAALSSWAAATPALGATTYVVSSNLDAQKEPGSGAACRSTAPGNPCTFRAAIETVNTVGSGNTIQVPGGLGPYTLNPALSSPILAVGAAIEATPGPVPQIDAGHAVIAFIANATDPVTISGLSFSNGSSAGVADFGGGLLNLVHVSIHGTSGSAALWATGPMAVDGGDVSQNQGGGVFAFSSATFNGTSVTRNLSGAGIQALGSLTMHGGSLSDNVNPTNSGGGLIAFSSANLSGTTVARNRSGGLGGGIEALASLALDDVKVTDNQAAGGAGGVLVDGTVGSASATISNSTLSGNSSQGSGGGIGVALGTLTLTGSTLNGNSSSQGDGGGIGAVGSSLSLTNDTLTGNTAPAFSGGGLSQTAVGPSRVRPVNALDAANQELQQMRAWLAAQRISAPGLPRSVPAPPRAPGRAPTAGTTLNSVTVAGNSAARGGGISNSLGVPLSVRDSIVGGNVSAAGDPNCLGPLTSAGYNIESAAGCGFKAGGDQQGKDPLLAPLAGNGGPTNTMALEPGSPAVDAGDPACPPPATDQRGVTRPMGARCDVGAYEAVPTANALLPGPALPRPPVTGHPPDGETGWVRLTALAGALALMVLISAAAAVRS